MGDYHKQGTKEKCSLNAHKLLKESMEGYVITEAEIITEDDYPDGQIKSIRLTLYNDLFENTNIVTLLMGDGFQIKGKRGGLLPEWRIKFQIP